MCVYGFFQTALILMKLGIPMFFGLIKMNLKLDFEISQKGGPQGGERGGNLYFMNFLLFNHFGYTFVLNRVLAYQNQILGKYYN